MNGYGGVGGAQQDRRPARPVQHATSGSRARVRDQRRRVPAARRSADDEQLGPGALRHAVEVSAQLPLQPQSVGGMELRRRSPAVRRSTSTRTRCSRTTGPPAWAEPEPAALRRSGHPRRSGRVRQRPALVWDYIEQRRAPRGVGRHLSRSIDRRPGHDFIEISPSLSYRPSSFLKVSTGMRFSRNHDESQWVEETRRPLRLRPAAPADVRAQRPR